MKKMSALLALALSALFVRAANITNFGRVYFDIALITNRCDAGGITFSHKSGIARLDFLELGEADQARYGFDPARYEAFKAEEARLRASAPPPPAPAPASPGPKPPPAPEARVVRRTTVITNKPPALTPFGSSPETTLGPDHNKMNETRLKAVQKAMEINSRK